MPKNKKVIIAAFAIAGAIVAGLAIGLGIHFSKKTTTTTKKNTSLPTSEPEKPEITPVQKPEEPKETPQKEATAKVDVPEVDPETKNPNKAIESEKTATEKPTKAEVLSDNLNVTLTPIVFAGTDNPVVDLQLRGLSVYKDRNVKVLYKSLGETEFKSEAVKVDKGIAQVLLNLASSQSYEAKVSVDGIESKPVSFNTINIGQISVTSSPQQVDQSQNYKITLDGLNQFISDNYNLQSQNLNVSVVYQNQTNGLLKAETVTVNDSAAVDVILHDLDPNTDYKYWVSIANGSFNKVVVPPQKFKTNLVTKKPIFKVNSQLDSGLRLTVSNLDNQVSTIKISATLMVGPEESIESPQSFTVEIQTTASELTDYQETVVDTSDSAKTKNETKKQVLDFPVVFPMFSGYKYKFKLEGKDAGKNYTDADQKSKYESEFIYQFRDQVDPVFSEVTQDYAIIEIPQSQGSDYQVWYKNLAENQYRVANVVFDGKKTYYLLDQDPLNNVNPKALKANGLYQFMVIESTNSGKKIKYRNTFSTAGNLKIADNLEKITQTTARLSFENAKKYLGQSLNFILKNPAGEVLTSQKITINSSDFLVDLTKLTKNTSYFFEIQDLANIKVLDGTFTTLDDYPVSVVSLAESIQVSFPNFLDAKTGLYGKHDYLFETRKLDEDDNLTKVYQLQSLVSDPAKNEVSFFQKNLEANSKYMWNLSRLDAGKVVSLASGKLSTLNPDLLDKTVIVVARNSQSNYQNTQLVKREINATFASDLTVDALVQINVTNLPVWAYKDSYDLDFNFYPVLNVQTLDDVNKTTTTVTPHPILSAAQTVKLNDFVVSENGSIGFLVKNLPKDVVYGWNITVNPKQYPLDQPLQIYQSKPSENFTVSSDKTLTNSVVFASETQTGLGAADFYVKYQLPAKNGTNAWADNTNFFLVWKRKQAVAGTADKQTYVENENNFDRIFYLKQDTTSKKPQTWGQVKLGKISSSAFNLEQTSSAGTSTLTDAVAKNTDQTGGVVLVRGLESKTDYDFYIVSDAQGSLSKLPDKSKAIVNIESFLPSWEDRTLYVRPLEGEVAKPENPVQSAVVLQQNNTNATSDKIVDPKMASLVADFGKKVAADIEISNTGISFEFTNLDYYLKKSDGSTALTPVLALRFRRNFSDYLPLTLKNEDGDSQQVEFKNSISEQQKKGELVDPYKWIQTRTTSIGTATTQQGNFNLNVVAKKPTRLFVSWEELEKLSNQFQNNDYLIDWAVMLRQDVKDISGNSSSVFNNFVLVQSSLDNPINRDKVFYAKSTKTSLNSLSLVLNIPVKYKNQDFLVTGISSALKGSGYFSGEALKNDPKNWQVYRSVKQSEIDGANRLSFEIENLDPESVYKFALISPDKSQVFYVSNLIQSQLPLITPAHNYAIVSLSGVTGEYLNQNLTLVYDTKPDFSSKSTLELGQVTNRYQVVIKTLNDLNPNSIYYYKIVKKDALEDPGIYQGMFITNNPVSFQILGQMSPNLNPSLNLDSSKLWVKLRVTNLKGYGLDYQSQASLPITSAKKNSGAFKSSYLRVEYKKRSNYDQKTTDWNSDVKYVVIPFDGNENVQDLVVGLDSLTSDAAAKYDFRFYTINPLRLMDLNNLKGKGSVATNDSPVKTINFDNDSLDQLLSATLKLDTSSKGLKEKILESDSSTNVKEGTSGVEVFYKLVDLEANGAASNGGLSQKTILEMYEPNLDVTLKKDASAVEAQNANPQSQITLVYKPDFELTTSGSTTTTLTSLNRENDPAKNWIRYWKENAPESAKWVVAAEKTKETDSASNKGNSDKTEFKFVLDNLEANTTYDYQIINLVSVRESGSFKTAPKLEVSLDKSSEGIEVALTNYSFYSLVSSSAKVRLMYRLDNGSDLDLTSTNVDGKDKVIDDEKWNYLEFSDSNFPKTGDKFIMFLPAKNLKPGKVIFKLATFASSQNTEVSQLAKENLVINWTKANSSSTSTNTLATNLNPVLSTVFTGNINSESWVEVSSLDDLGITNLASSVITKKASISASRNIFRERVQFYQISEGWQKSLYEALEGVKLNSFIESESDYYFDELIQSLNDGAVKKLNPNFAGWYKFEKSSQLVNESYYLGKDTDNRDVLIVGMAYKVPRSTNYLLINLYFKLDGTKVLAKLGGLKINNVTNNDWDPSRVVWNWKTGRNTTILLDTFDLAKNTTSDSFKDKYNISGISFKNFIKGPSKLASNTKLSYAADVLKNSDALQVKQNQNFANPLLFNRFSDQNQINPLSQSSFLSRDLVGDGLVYSVANLEEELSDLLKNAAFKFNGLDIVNTNYLTKEDLNKLKLFPISSAEESFDFQGSGLNVLYRNSDGLVYGLKILAVVSPQTNNAGKTTLGLQFSYGMRPRMLANVSETGFSRLTWEDFMLRSRIVSVADDANANGIGISSIKITKDFAGILNANRLPLQQNLIVKSLVASPNTNESAANVMLKLGNVDPTKTYVLYYFKKNDTPTFNSLVNSSFQNYFDNPEQNKLKESVSPSAGYVIFSGNLGSQEVQLNLGNIAINGFFELAIFESFPNGMLDYSGSQNTYLNKLVNLVGRPLDWPTGKKGNVNFWYSPYSLPFSTIVKKVDNVKILDLESFQKISNSKISDNSSSGQKFLNFLKDGEVGANNTTLTNVSASFGLGTYFDGQEFFSFAPNDATILTGNSITIKEQNNTAYQTSYNSLSGSTDDEKKAKALLNNVYNYRDLIESAVQDVKIKFNVSSTYSVKELDFLDAFEFFGFVPYQFGNKLGSGTQSDSKDPLVTIKDFLGAGGVTKYVNGSIDSSKFSLVYSFVNIYDESSATKYEVFYLVFDFDLGGGSATNKNAVKTYLVYADTGNKLELENASSNNFKGFEKIDWKTFVESKKSS